MVIEGIDFPEDAATSINPSHIAGLMWNTITKRMEVWFSGKRRLWFNKDSSKVSQSVWVSVVIEECRKYSQDKELGFFLHQDFWIAYRWIKDPND